MSDNRKHSRRKEGRKRMDRRVGDRRADGVPPAPDTPAKHDTGRRRRKADHKASLLLERPKPGLKFQANVPTPDVRPGCSPFEECASNSRARITTNLITTLESRHTRITRLAATLALRYHGPRLEAQTCLRVAKPSVELISLQSPPHESCYMSQVLWFSSPTKSRISLQR